MIFEGIEVYTGKAKQIVVENGYVSSVKELDSNSKQCNLPYLSRGFIDMQVNGYMGIDYSGDDLSVEKIISLCELLRATGTLRHVPTIITNSEERIIKNLHIIAEAVRNNKLAKACIAGIHVEGPFISSLDGPRGAHDIKYVRNPSFEEFSRWQDAADDLIKIVTVAPEKEGAGEFTKLVTTKTNTTIAIGHCEPSPAQIDNLVKNGASLSTHLGNGSSAVLPRLKNHIWKQLSIDELSAGMICDGYHIPEYTFKAMYKIKGADNTILVSDVAPPGGMPKGLTKWGDIDVEVCSDGHLSLWGTELLAGAGHLLDYDIVQFMKFTDSSLLDAIKLVTDNPAKILGIESDMTEFTVGEKADIISFNIDGKLNVDSFAQYVED